MDTEIFWKQLLRSGEDMLFSCFISSCESDEPDGIEGIMIGMSFCLYSSNLSVLTARLIVRSRVHYPKSHRVSRKEVLEDQEPLVRFLAL